MARKRKNAWTQKQLAALDEFYPNPDWTLHRIARKVHHTGDATRKMANRRGLCRP